MKNGDQFKTLVQTAKRILIIQAENPDGDSLGTALALEEIFGELGKTPLLYCPVIIPRYLRFIPGWDRVSDEFPDDFDLGIIVDTSTATLLERVLTPNQQPRLAAKPLVVLDHHQHEIDIPVETIPVVSHSAVATGELAYELSKAFDWPLTVAAGERIATAILFDSLGLTTSATTARTFHIMGELVELGVDVSELDNRRRQLMKRSRQLVTYKAALMQRIEYHLDDRLATVIIPWEEIEAYSDQYNPSMLVIEEMRLTTAVLVAAAFKLYPDGKITCKLRTNPEAPIARDLAAHFGGGGHPQAAGFKVRGAKIEEIMFEMVATMQQLLEKHDDSAV